MTELDLYYRLQTKSRRAIHKTKKRWGKRYQYSPRIDLLKRLSEETGMSVINVRNQLLRERAEILRLNGHT
jgi:hypothetical protein